MQRRELLAAVFSAIPAIAVAQQPAPVQGTADKFNDLIQVLNKASRVVVDQLRNDQATVAAFFYGVLASQDLHDFAVAPEQKPGNLIDIAVQFNKGEPFIYIPVKFSPDYWERAGSTGGLR